ncbi:MAG TPA: YrdB family protein [Balneolaceae bacterium]|nr:YrdB family protein [Balneolaceae bacterium]
MTEVRQPTEKLSKLQWINLALRGLMETGIVLAFAFWGYRIGGNKSMKILLCIAVPLVGFGFWGAVDFSGMGKLSETLRLIQELVISGLAALALYVTGAHVWGIVLVSISIVHHALVYSLGETLLKN